MIAVRIHQPGGPEVLQYEDCPDPTAGPGQVLVRTAAIGLNFAETRARQGAAPASLPLIPGGEAAGTVVAVGSGVTEFSEGDAVAVANASQCYAELVAAPAGRTVKLPPGMAATLAAASLVQGMTAHCMALGAYKVRRNDWILVHAGAGGVGMLITQMAKRRGAKVIATVGSDAKVAAAKEAGADVVVNYTTQDFEVEVKSVTNGIGVNGIFDSVGKDTFLKGLNCLAELGTIAVFGYASGDTDPLDINLLHRGGHYVTRTGMGHFTGTREQWLLRAKEVLDWAHSGVLEVRTTEYPLSQAAEAHRALQGRESIGKLLLIP